MWPSSEGVREGGRALFLLEADIYFRAIIGQRTLYLPERWGFFCPGRTIDEGAIQLARFATQLIGQFR